jgi:hypothetical protein
MSAVDVPALESAPSAQPRWPWAAALALALAHFIWLMSYFAPATTSPDANGYVVQARLIATQGRTGFMTASPAQFVGMHWLETTPGMFYSRYPAGLPMIFAGAWKIGGLSAALLINPVLASATVLLVYLLSRRFNGPGPALVAAAVMALAPVANEHALDADSHTATGFFLVAGVLALLRFDETRSWRWGLLAGVLLGVVPTVRYPEVLVGAAVGVWLLWRFRPVWRVWPAVLGAALPVGALCAHNAAAYGAFWRTGYALTHEQTGFGLNYFFAHALPYLQALNGQGLSLFFAFGVAGFAAMVADPRRRSVGVLFVGIVLPLVLLYMAYYFGGGPGGGGAGGGPGGAGGGGAGAMTGNLRFLVPEFPFFAVTGAWLLAQLLERSGPAGRVALIAVAAVQFLIAGSASLETLNRTGRSLASGAIARRFAGKEIPEGSVLIVDRSLAESLDATGSWRLVEETMVSGGGGRGGPMGQMGPMGGRRPGGGGGRGGLGGRELDPDSPSPQQIGKNVLQQQRYANLSADERRTRVWADLSTWAGGKSIYWFMRSLDTLDEELPTGATYKNLGEIDAPAMGPGGGGPGPMGAGGGRAGGFPGGGGRGGRGPGAQMGPPGLMAGGERGGPPGEDGARNAEAKLHLIKIELPKAKA